MTKDAAQRRKWTFYKAVNNKEEKMSIELKQNIKELYLKLEHLKDYL
jgi:hypothetical protein